VPEQNIKKEWKIIELIKWSAHYLKEKGVENPRTSAEILLGFVLNLKRIDLYLNYDRILKEDELINFREVIKRRAKKEPLQYITGSTEFMSLPFNVNPTVFIPRPETEILVENIIDISKERWKEKNVINILDIGTGCGNIAVCLAKYIDNSKIFAIDISDEILKIAEENAKLNSASDKINFKNLSIFDAGQTEFKDIHIVVSNPPYISLNDFPSLPDEVKLHEPEKGLHDNSDGLSFFKVICEKSKHWLTTDGMLFMEVGLGESENVCDIMKSSGFSKIKILKDYQQIKRIVFCENKNN